LECNGPQRRPRDEREGGAAEEEEGNHRGEKQGENETKLGDNLANSCKREIARGGERERGAGGIAPRAERTSVCPPPSGSLFALANNRHRGKKRSSSGSRFHAAREETPWMLGMQMRERFVWGVRACVRVCVRWPGTPINRDDDRKIF